MFNGVDIRSESRFDELDTNSGNSRMDLEQSSPTRLRFTLLAGRSTSEFRNPVQTTTTLDAPNVNGYTIDFRDNGQRADHHLSVRRRNTARSASSARRPSVTAGELTRVEIRIRPQGADNTFTDRPRRPRLGSADRVPDLQGAA